MKNEELEKIGKMIMKGSSKLIDDEEFEPVEGLGDFFYEEFNEAEWIMSLKVTDIIPEDYEPYFNEEIGQPDYRAVVVYRSAIETEDSSNKDSLEALSLVNSYEFYLKKKDDKYIIIDEDSIFGSEPNYWYDGEIDGEEGVLKKLENDFKNIPKEHIYEYDSMRCPQGLCSIPILYPEYEE